MTDDSVYISKAVHTVYWRSTVVFPAFEREPGSTGSHPHRPETHREKSVCRSSSAENMGPPWGQSNTPAPGFSLPSQWRSSSCGPPTASDRPGWSWEATNTDCCTWDGRSMGQKTKQNSSKKWQELPPSFCHRAGSSPQQLWGHRTTGCRAVAREGAVDTQIKGHSSSFRSTWLWLCSGSGPYLCSEQHVVHQLHVRLHLRPLNVVQAVAQRVTLGKKRRSNLTNNPPVLDWNQGASLKTTKIRNSTCVSAGLVIVAPLL